MAGQDTEELDAGHQDKFEFPDYLDYTAYRQTAQNTWYGEHPDEQKSIPGDLV